MCVLRTELTDIRTERLFLDVGSNDQDLDVREEVFTARKRSRDPPPEVVSEIIVLPNQGSDVSQKGNKVE